MRICFPQIAQIYAVWLRFCLPQIAQIYAALLRFVSRRSRRFTQNFFYKLARVRLGCTDFNSTKICSDPPSPRRTIDAFGAARRRDIIPPQIILRKSARSDYAKASSDRSAGNPFRDLRDTIRREPLFNSRESPRLTVFQRIVNLQHRFAEFVNNKMLCHDPGFLIEQKEFISSHLILEGIHTTSFFLSF